MKRKEERMIKQVHGIDRHKRYSTIVVMNMEGAVARIIKQCADLEVYIRELTEEDAVILESANGTYHWADKMNERGASVYIVDTRKFKIIKDSWKKTDKQDAKNLAWALWVNLKSDTFGLPLVEKPDYRNRELRRLFAQYRLLNEQLIKLKTVIQASLSDTGIALNPVERKRLFHEEKGKAFLQSLKTTPSVRTGVSMNLDLLWLIETNKEKLKEEILRQGEYLKDDVELLMSIKGVSPLVALAFLADVWEITRFSSQRKLNAYLGVVPNAKSSGGKDRSGHISRASRNLTRWILSQSIPHIVKSSPVMQNRYDDLIHRRGFGRARMAIMRKTIGIMRRILLSRKKYSWTDEKSLNSKLLDYRRRLRRLNITS
jgi:transposase